MEHAVAQCKIIFFGTPEFAVPTLQALINAGYDIVAVVTQPDKPVGRGLKMEPPAVKVHAQLLGIPVLQLQSLRKTRGAGFDDRQNQPPSPYILIPPADCGVAVAYGKIIPKEILTLFPKGILNLHPSLLPKYRGPSPIQAAILNGDPETGVTIMLLDAEMDHGAVLIQNPHLISPLERGRKRGLTGGELSKILAQEGAKLLVETLPKYLAGKITPQPQDHARATFTKLLEREDGHVDWSKPAEAIERLVRAYDPWPGTWTQWNGMRLKILYTSLLNLTIGCAENATPGYVWKTENVHLAVNCNPGSIILEELQLAGKNAMSGQEFLRGSPKFLSSVLK